MHEGMCVSYVTCTFFHPSLIKAHHTLVGVHIGFSDAVQQPNDGLLLDFAAGPAADRGSPLLTGTVHAAGLCVAECDHRPQCARARPVPRRLQSLACMGLDLLHHLVSSLCLPLTS